MNKQFIAYRQQAIDWWNSKERDFDQGISILESSGFKPGVVRKLKKDGVNGPDAKARIKFLIRELMKAWAMSPEELADTDAEQGIIQGKDIRQDKLSGENQGESLVVAAEKLELDESSYPESVAAVIREYAGAYKDREKYHRLMADLSEENTPEIVAKRKEFSDLIAGCTDKMEQLYPIFEKYTQTGEVPAPEALKKEEVKPEKTTENDYKSMSKEELQKLRKSVSTKIGRAKNMLEFQQESKAEKPNPMPECPKRVRYTTKIETLSKELTQIDYAIAALG